MVNSIINSLVSRQGFKKMYVHGKAKLNMLAGLQDSSTHGPVFKVLISTLIQAFREDVIHYAGTKWHTL